MLVPFGDYLVQTGHHESGQSFALVGGENVDVCEVGEGEAVGYQAAEAY